MACPMAGGRSSLLLLRASPRRWQQRRQLGTDPSGRNPVFLVFPAICAGLGTWQVYRRQWKLDLIERMERRLSSQPSPIKESVSPLLGSLAEWEYCPVTVTGRFDHSREALVGPRHRVDPDDPGDDRRRGGGGGLIGSSERVGFHVVTPLRVSSSGEWILVNRGWVPKDLADPATRPQGQPDGQVTIGGLVRQGDTSSWLLESPAAGKKQQQKQQQQRRWLGRDLGRMSAELDTLPFLIDADADSSIEDGPVGGQTRISLRNEHLNYSITWYTLGGLLLLLWIFRVR